MRNSWAPYVAIAAGAALLLKAVLIFSTEGDVSGGLTGGLYLGGLLLALAAAVGYALTTRHRTVIGIGLVLALVAWVIGIGDLTAPAFEAVFGDEAYVGDEGPVGLLGVVLLALGARAKVAGRDPLPA